MKMRFRAVRLTGMCTVVATLFGAVLAAPAGARGAEEPDAPARAAAAADARPFAVDHDAPLDAEQAVDVEHETFTRYRVEFNGIRGDRVPAYLYLPKGAAPAAAGRPAVLLQYGSGGNKRTNYIVALGEQFAGRGFVVLTIDVPLRGERKPRSARGWAQTFAETGRFPWYLGDYSRAIDYLLTRPEVDARRVGYAGISWGAITGVTFVAHEPRVRAMASIVGGGDLLAPIRGELPPETRAAARRIDPVHHVARIAPRPLLLLNVTRDQLVPRFMADALHRAAGDAPTTRKEWVETDHFFRGVDRYAVLGRVIDFMEQSLPPATP